MLNNYTNFTMGQGHNATNDRRGRNDELGRDEGGDKQIDNTKVGLRKKEYHRHTQKQIQELEMFFKNCQHPDYSQMKMLSSVVGLDPLKIKFWFQNKRNQMKVHLDRYENFRLKDENDRIRSENIILGGLLGNTSCLTCGGQPVGMHVHQLRMENARLKEEVDRMTIRAGVAPKDATWEAEELSQGAISRIGGGGGTPK